MISLLISAIFNWSLYFVSDALTEFKLANTMISKDRLFTESQHQSPKDHFPIHQNSMKRSFSTDSFSSSKSCICSPTKHEGSFRCRLHRFPPSQLGVPAAKQTAHNKPSASGMEAKWVSATSIYSGYVQNICVVEDLYRILISSFSSTNLCFLVKFYVMDLYVQNSNDLISSPTIVGIRL